MYHHLRGTVMAVAPGQVVLDLGGVGYDLTVSLATSQALATGQEITLLTHLWVREDNLTLYGFLESSERGLFRTLLGLNGVGPSLALSILGACNPDQFAVAVEQQDSSYLTRIKGVGPKKANQIMVGLKGARMKLEPTSGSAGLPAGPQQEAVLALRAMGMGEGEALERVRRAVSDHGDAADAETLIRGALQA